MIEPHTFTPEQEHNINIVLDVLNHIYKLPKTPKRSKSK